MAETDKLVIPAGVRFEIQESGVAIEYAGDILLQGDHEKPVAHVISTEGNVETQGNMQVGAVTSHTGSVAISGDVQVDQIQAQESVQISGKVRANRIEATRIESMDGELSASQIEGREAVDLRGNVMANHIGAPSVAVHEGRLQAKAIEATERVTLGSAELHIDIVIAPQVSVDPHTRGRVAVIQSDNDLGPNGLRGAFRLEEFAEFTNQNPQSFLAERGVGGEGEIPSGPPPSAVPEPAPVPEPIVQAVPEPAPVPEPVVEAVPEPAPVPADLTSHFGGGELQSKNNEPEPVRIAVDDTPEQPNAVSVEIDDDGEFAETDTARLEPVAEPKGEPGEIAYVSPIHRELCETVERIVEAYETDEVPPAVMELKDMIVKAHFEQVRGEITNIWNNLLKYHQRTGTRLQHQVTTTFNTINTLVRKLG